MKIEWQAESGARGLITIFVDEEMWREGHRSILGTRPQLPKECASFEELQQIYDTLEYQGAKKYIYRRLAMKSCSTFELRSQLEDKRVTPGTIDRAIAECQQLGYLNDEEWVESFVRGQLARYAGPQLVKAKLRQHGVPEVQISAALARCGGTEKEKESIERLLKTRYRSRDLSDPRERNKVIAAILRKGFPLPIILDVLSS